LDILNNREWALVIWASILACYLILSPNMKEVRTLFKKLLSSFFVRPIQTVVFLMLVYIAGIIYFLFEFQLWDIGQAKNTVIWVVSVGFMSLFKLEAIKKDRVFFKHSVLDNLKLIAIIQFVIGVYSFSLLVELLLVPMLAFAESNDKYSQVNKLLNNLMAVFGLVVIICTVYMLITDFREIAKEQTIYDFTIPPLLTLLYIPFIFFMMVYSTYEQVFIRLSFFIKKPKIRLLAKTYAIFVFNVRTELMERWASSLPYADTGSHKGILRSIKKIFKMRAAERNPRAVTAHEGWFPYKAKDFLFSQGFQTGYYHESYDGWNACSPMIEIGQGLFPNNIAYYVDGNEKSAKSLKVKVNINDKEESNQANAKLLEAAKRLYKAALNSEFPVWLEEAIIKGNQVEEEIDCFKVSYQKEEWPNHRYGGYHLIFTIQIVCNNCEVF
jgi:hypothetical protein